MTDSDSVSRMQQVVDDWAAAERNGDTRALSGMLTEDFAGIGPRGFQLAKEQWLDRYDSGDLVNEDFQASEVTVRYYGAETAITNGVLTQQAAYRGHPFPGRFRFTAVLVGGQTSWRIANLQLSMLDQ